MNTYEFDVVIVGSGPAGCICVLCTSRADLRTVIVDKKSAAGALAITHKIANYPGVSGSASGNELLDVVRQQAVDFGAMYQQAQVFNIDVSRGEKRYIP